MSDTSAPPAYLTAGCVPEVKAIDTARRTVTHLISTAAMDRVGDIIEPLGWETANFMRNPVVLADHDYRIERIIGRAVSVDKSANGLFATTQFHDRGLGAEAWALTEAGMARSWSVGFRPLAYEPIKGQKGELNGYRYKQQELLEYSLVAIPANPEVVMGLCRRGLITEAGATAFFRAALSSPVDAAPNGATANASTHGPSSNSRYDAILGEILDRMRRIERGQTYLAREKQHGND